MGMDVTNYKQCAVTLPTPVQPEQAATNLLHGQNQHVRGYETLTLIGVRDRSESWVHTDKAEREQGIQTAYVSQAERLIALGQGGLWTLPPL